MSRAPGAGPHWAERAPGRLALGAAIPALVLAAWWAGARGGSAVVPGFAEVWDVLSHPLREPPDLQSPSLAFSAAITLARFAAGFLLAAATAVPLGVAAARSPVVESLLHPAVALARPVNPVVLLPLLTVLLGLTSPATLLFGEREAWRHAVLDQLPLAMLVILWYGAFFPIYLATLHGVRAVRTAYLETLRLLGAGRRQELRWLLLPHALPQIAAGMRIALGVAWLVLIAAELFPGTRSGLGYMLCTACKTSEYEYTFAALILIGAIGLVLDGALRRLERRVGHWQAAER